MTSIIPGLITPPSPHSTLGGVIGTPEEANLAGQIREAAS